MITLFFSALVLGFIFNAAPGAVFAETIRYSMRGGFRPALAVQFGSLAGDALWAVLGLVGVGLLLQLEILRFPVGIAGMLYLFWLAWGAWREASTDVRVSSTRQAETHRDALRSGVLLSITNPQNVAYWAALGSAMGAVGVTHPTATDYVIFFLAFMLSSLLWSFLCAGVVATVFRYGSGAWSRLTYRACAIAFVILALASLRNLWQTYTPVDDGQSISPNPAPSANIITP